MRKIVKNDYIQQLHTVFFSGLTYLIYKIIANQMFINTPITGSIHYNITLTSSFDLYIGLPSFKC